MVGRPDYETRQAMRRERLEKRADRLARESSNRFEAARASIEHIPPGQPILVGHHSEKRHRADLARHDNHMRKAVDLGNKAKVAASRAASVGTAGISSDDPTALEQIEARIAELEKKQALMRDANRLLRKKDTKAGDAGLRALGLNDAQIAKLRAPNWCGRIGFDDFSLKNNGANIRRLQKRLKTLERVDQATDSEERFGDVVVEIVPSDNRVRVRFPGKPSADIRKRARGYGFRWAPSEGAWQRHYSTSAVYWARELAKLATEGKEQSQ